MKIGWVNGEWLFTRQNQDTLRIRAGVENTLGKPGGDLFLFPGRKVTIHNFSFDLDRSKITFFGTCSTAKSSSGRRFKSTLVFWSLNSMRMRSWVFMDEIGHYKEKTKVFMKWDPKTGGLVVEDSGSEFESDSSVD